MTPYMLGILLDVYCGRPISVSPDAPIFKETIDALWAEGLIQPYDDAGARPSRLTHAPTAKLRCFFTHVLSLPMPEWRMP